MADNVTLPGTGAVVATDEVAGRQYQLVKLAVGGDGVAVQADAANPIPVGVQSLPLPAGAATETTLAAVNAKLPALSGGGRIPVELPAGGAGLTNSELRATAVPVSAASLPLPTGAATETTLAGVNAKLPALSGGRIPVELPAGGSGLTDAELRAEAVPVTDGAAGSLLWRILQVLLSPLGYDKSLQRQRGTVILESGTVTTVTTVTTVGTLGNIATIDGYSARIQVLGQNQTAWQACVRARIT